MAKKYQARKFLKRFEDKSILPVIQRKLYDVDFSDDSEVTFSTDHIDILSIPHSLRLLYCTVSERVKYLRAERNQFYDVSPPWWFQHTRLPI